MDGGTGLQRDVVVVEELLEADLVPAGQVVVAGHGNGQGVVGIGMGCKTVGIAAGDDDADIGLLAVERFERIDARSFLQIDFDRGLLFGEGREIGG